MWIDLGKIIVAAGFVWLPKVQKIAQSGHTVIHNAEETFVAGIVVTDGSISINWQFGGKVSKVTQT